MQLFERVRSKFSTILLVWWLVAVPFYVFQLGGAVTKPFVALLYLSTFFLEIAAAVFTMKKYDGYDPQYYSFRYVVIGLWLVAGGQFFWFVLKYLMGLNPFPSIADVSYLVGYVFLAMGLILKLRLLRFNWKRKHWSLVALAALILASAVFHFEIIDAFRSEEPFLTNLIAASYGVADIGLIVISALILVYAFDYPKAILFNPWLSVFAAQVFILVGDFFFSMHADHYANDVYPYTLIGFLWYTGNLLLAHGLYRLGEPIHKKVSVTQESVDQKESSKPQ